MSHHKLETHIIQNFAPSCLNRDDNNAPKEAIFGGSRRLRISSQCFKRAIRLKSHEYLSDESKKAIRSKKIYREIAERLGQKYKEYGSDDLERWAKHALSLIKKKNKEKEDEESSMKYSFYLGHNQIDGIVQAIAQSIGDNPDDPWANLKKNLNKRMIERAIKEESVEISMFGRMLADSPDLNVEACCQMAHVISTHKVNRDFDFFTTVDDIIGDEESGADMLGITEFGSACYYRYAVVDVTRLYREYQGKAADDAKQMLEAYLRASILAVPSGKQNAFAAHNPPAFVGLVWRDREPRNLCNAFENPVRLREKDRSLSSVSVEELVKHETSMEKIYGSEGDKRMAAFLDLTDGGEGWGERHDNVDSLVKWAMESASELTKA